MADITMPQLGETVTEGTITKWFKSVGDQVAADETLFEVSTDKVDSEVPSPAAGYLTEILVQEGETVDVGAKLAVISADAPAGGSAPAAPAAPAPEGAPEPAGPSGRAQDPPAPVAEERGPAAEEASPAPSGTVVQEAAPEPPSQPEPQPRPDAELEPAAAVIEAAGGEVGGAAGKALSPVVRRLIAEHGLEPAQIPGTGTGGRITRNDVQAFVDRDRGAAPQPQPAPQQQTESRAAPAQAQPQAEAQPQPRPAAPADTQAAPARGDEVVPFSNIRRRTAEHMIRSQATSAHVLTAIEVDYANVDKVRIAHREEFRESEGFSLTYLPFVSMAVVDAIRQFPNLNASVGDDSLIVHHDIHLGIAVDMDFNGLIVPVIHDADGLRLRAIARRVVDLAQRARSKKLTADDIAGGTFTITNPGPFGTFLTAPVINQPQVAILSTDGVKKRPVAVALPDGSDGIAVHPTGNLALCFDHRAFDGAYASAFLARCKEILETRAWAGEL